MKTRKIWIALLVVFLHLALGYWLFMQQSEPKQQAVIVEIPVDNVPQTKQVKPETTQISPVAENSVAKAATEVEPVVKNTPKIIGSGEAVAKMTPNSGVEKSAPVVGIGGPPQAAQSNPPKVAEPVKIVVNCWAASAIRVNAMDAREQSVKVAVVRNTQGKVLSAHVKSSTGSAALDAQIESKVLKNVVFTEKSPSCEGVSGIITVQIE